MNDKRKPKAISPMFSFNDETIENLNYLKRELHLNKSQIVDIAIRILYEDYKKGKLPRDSREIKTVRGNEKEAKERTLFDLT